MSHFGIEKLIVVTGMEFNCFTVSKQKADILIL